MIRSHLIVTILVILYTDGVFSRTLTVHYGDSFPISVLTFGHNVQVCRLISPQNDIQEFPPGNTEQSTDKYVISADSMFGCTVTVQDVDKNDEGPWTITYDTDSETVTARSETFNIMVAERRQEPEVSEEEVDSVKLLTPINHFTRTNATIDISLDRKSYAETCYIMPPNGVLIKADDFKMENVIVQKSSDFVSCRITLGPITADLLGGWRLCGQPAQNQESGDEMRCQPANIAWNNNNPDALWGTTVQSKVNHPVNFGGTVNPGVAGTGNVVTCHVITPGGEDLVITNDVDYPNIQRIAFDRPLLCSIKITVADKSSVGDWTIYGKFRASTIGLNEVHLPMTFFLYNNDNPYEQAYNVTVLREATHLAILGTSLDVNLSGSGEVNDCQYITPTGQSYTIGDSVGPTGVVLEHLDTAIGCRITIDPITENLLGEWQIIGKFSNGNQFTERRQTFNIVKEDPANPIEEDFRIVENLTPLNFVDTELGVSHVVTISSQTFINGESCHILTPNGLQYAFINGFNVPDVEIVQRPGVECGVDIHVKTVDMIGEWTLIARANRLSNPIERRQSFTIRIEEVTSLGNAITITEGADLYLRLPNPTELYDTCRIYAPNDDEIIDVETDKLHAESCGFIVRRVSHDQRGTWKIVYGNKILYKATIQVNVLEPVEIAVDNLFWTAGSAVNETVGPKDAVYCWLQDGSHNTVFEGFGPCRIVVDRVTDAHYGKWSIHVGIPGAVILRYASFFVNVQPADSRIIVTPSVQRDGSSVLMSCSVPLENELQACKFRDPGGKVLITSHGVGQDAYAGSVISYESDVERHECTLRLLNPQLERQGIWRCAVHTDHGTGYGFLPYSNSLMEQQNSYRIEPQLETDEHSFMGVEGQPVTLSCSIETAIHYCYFRAPNGTIFNVFPSVSTTSSGFVYIGNGFDAGECGVRFQNLNTSDTGTWSCSVGLVSTGEEQIQKFEVDIAKKITVEHDWEGDNLVVVMEISSKPLLEYCRFVRSDGLGFNSMNVPEEYYVDTSVFLHGSCKLIIPDPKNVDLWPWTVFAKVVGVNEELSITTSSYWLVMPLPQKTPLIKLPLFWISLVLLCSSTALALVTCSTKKRRKWTYIKAVRIRDSFRRNPQTLPTTVPDNLPPKV